MSASRLCPHWLCWCLVVLALSLPHDLRAETSSTASLRWGPLRQLAVGNAPGATAMSAASLRPVEPKLPVTLAPSELLLIPVQAEQALHIAGSEHQWGFGFGVTGVPDAITWYPTRAAEHNVVVPSWGAARFVVVRVARAGQVRVAIAERVADPLALVRRDDRVRRWLRSEQNTPPEELKGAERATLTALGVLRDTLGESISTLAPSQRAQAHEALGELLLAEWLADQYAERPLVAPFFIPNRLTATTLPRKVIEADDGAQWSELEAGEGLSWDPGEADVFEFSISTDATRAARFAVAQGAQRIERELVAAALPVPGTFRPAVTLRLVLRTAEAVRLVASSGALRVSVRALSAEEALEDLRPRRSVRRLLERAARRLEPGRTGLSAALSAVSATALMGAQGASWGPGIAASIAALRLPWLAPEHAPLEALQTFWQQSHSLSERQRRALLVWVLWKVHQRWPLQDSPEALVFRDSVQAELRAGMNHDAEPSPVVVQALLDSVVPPLGAGRSVPVAQLEANSVLGEHWPRLPSAVWRRAAPWVTQVPTPGARSALDWQTPEPAEPGTECPVLGPEGLRWSVIAQAPIAFDAAPIWGTHQVLRFQPLPRPTNAAPALPVSGSLASQLPGDSLVAVDEGRFSVLPLLGVGSGVAVAAGQHRVSVVQGDPVLAQLPRSGLAPCAQLRSAERWAELEANVEFELPLGDVPTVASVRYEPRDRGPTAWPARAVLVVGSKRYEAMFHTPNATLEVPVAPGVTRLAIAADKPGRARVRARQQRTLGKGAASDPLAASVPGVTASPASQKSSEPPPVLDRLRQLGQQLARATTATEGATLRAERARLLTELGYRRLAELDQLRRADALGLPGDAATVEAAANATRAANPTLRNEVWLPGRKERVLALDRAADLIPLPDDVASEVLQQAYAEIRRGALDQARERLLTAGAEQQAGRAALALAYGFETDGEPARAATIYERVARHTPHPAILARQVITLTNAAFLTGDRATLTRAHWLARRAVEGGARPGPLLGPIAPYVEWDSPTLSALGFGGAKVAQRGESEEIVTEVSELRAALLDKPPLARWFSPEASVSLLEGPTELSITSLCFDRQGPREACHFEPQIDGAPVRCSSEPTPSTAAHAAGDAARPERCRFVVPRGARRLRWVTAAGDPLGWLLLEAPDATRTWQALPQALSYTEATPNVPLLVDVAGPAVLRVTARGKPGAPARVEVRVADAGGNAVGVPAVLELPTLADPGAQRLDIPAELGRSVSSIVLIERKGLHRVSIASTSSDVLVRPELARVRTPELMAPASATIVASDGVGVGQESPIAFDLPRVAPAPSPGAVTVSADLALIDQVKTEEASHEVRAEAGITLRKALIEDQLWLRTELQGRLREGPSSAALEAYVSWAARETSPGFFALGRATTQSQAGRRFARPSETLASGEVSEPGAGAAVGYFATLGASHMLPLSERLALLPSVDVVLRGADNSVRGMRGLDPGVYSHYAWIHPRSWEALLWLIYRARYDSVLQTAVQLRLNPDLDAIDHVQGVFVWKWLGGSGYWPWITWQTQLTWYEQSRLRQMAFARLHTSPAATFWRWLGNGDRVRATFSCGAQWDEPSPDFVQPALFASVALGYDFSGEQGLRDFIPFERPFRRRLEEGSKRVTTRAAGSNPHWAWEPAP